MQIPADGEETIEGSGLSFRQPDFDAAAASGSGAEPVTMLGIAALLKEHLAEQLAPMTSIVERLRQDFEKLDLKVTTMGETLSSRLSDVEANITTTEVRVDKLEHLCEELSKNAPPRPETSRP